MPFAAERFQHSRRRHGRFSRDEDRLRHLHLLGSTKRSRTSTLRPEVLAQPTLLDIVRRPSLRQVLHTHFAEIHRQLPAEPRPVPRQWRSTKFR